MKLNLQNSSIKWRLSTKRLQCTKLLPEEAQAFNLKCVFIMCFNRDRTIESALEHLTLALPYRDLIIGVGTDNLEHTGFPTNFAPIFEKAAKFGFRLTSHCDVDYESSADNIRGCLELLRVERIDHGVNILEDEQLINLARFFIYFLIYLANICLGKSK
jgi:adenosine deaminase